MRDVNHYLKKIDKRIVIGLGAIGSGILYLKVISPVFGIHIACPIKHVTGFDCPGCGMTRTALNVLDGNFYQAFRFNSLVFILAPLFLIYYLLILKGKKKQSDLLLFAMLGLTLVYGVLRNTPMFSFLAPTAV